MGIIALGADHGGFELKEAIKDHLLAQGLSIIDCGTDSAEAVDYPLFGQAVARLIAAGEAEKGVVVCGTGIGVSIAVNKTPGVRAALCTDGFMARLAREHNDAQVLALGARVLGQGLALEIVDIFLTAEFAGGRHARRVGLLE